MLGQKRYKIIIDCEEFRAPSGAWRAEWVAYDEETYDGAPDAGKNNTIGIGSSPNDAVNDLFDQLELQHQEMSVAFNIRK